MENKKGSVEKQNFFFVHFISQMNIFSFDCIFIIKQLQKTKNMKKITSKNQLEQVIVQIIKEQLNMQKNYQQGQQQGAAAGQATKQALVKGVNELSRVGKEVLVRIGNTSFKIITIGVGAAAYTVWAIGTGLWKIGTAASNAIIKVLASTGKILIGGATALGTATLDLFKKAGIVISQGAQAFMNGLKSLADKGTAALKWVVGLGAQFGKKYYAYLLATVNRAGVLASQLGNFLAQQWNTVAKNVGIGWEKAKQLGSSAWSSLKSGVNAVGNAIGNTAKNALNYGSKLAGNVGGFIRGLFEIFERLNSFTSKTSLGILKEARYISATVL